MIFEQGILFKRSFCTGPCKLWASLVALLVKSPPAVQETQFDSWFGKIPWRRGYPLQYSWASLVAQTVKNLPAIQETWVRSLGWEDPLEEGVVTHSSIPAYRIPMDRGAWWARSCKGVAKSQTWLSDSTAANYVAGPENIIPVKQENSSPKFSPTLRETKSSHCGRKLQSPGPACKAKWSPSPSFIPSGSHTKLEVLQN